MRISDWSSDVCSSDLKLSATVKTAVTEVEVVGTTGERIKRTSADQILVAGELKSGVVASVRLSGASSPGTGIRLEINGDDGDLVITAAAGGRGIQMSDLRLQKTVGMAELIDVEEIGRATCRGRVCQNV